MKSTPAPSADSVVDQTASPLFASSSGVQEALAAVASDLRAVSQAIVSGTSALRGACARPANCTGASELSSCLSEVYGRLEQLTSKIQVLPARKCAQDARSCRQCLFFIDAHAVSLMD